jgi:hypothetical protein
VVHGTVSRLEQALVPWNRSYVTWEVM